MELNESRIAIVPTASSFSDPARHTPAVGPAIEAINFEEYDGPAPDAPEPTEG